MYSSFGGDLCPGHLTPELNSVCGTFLQTAPHHCFLAAASLAALKLNRQLEEPQYPRTFLVCRSVSGTVSARAPPPAAWSDAHSVGS